MGGDKFGKGQGYAEVLTEGFWCFRLLGSRRHHRRSRARCSQLGSADTATNVASPAALAGAFFYVHGGDHMLREREPKQKAETRSAATPAKGTAAATAVEEKLPAPTAARAAPGEDGEADEYSVMGVVSNQQPSQELSALVKGGSCGHV